jgi:uncharacterized protein YdaU (DUF1376 family)
VNFYKRDPDAALAGMVELSLEERGAYNTIIDLLYSRDGDLPDDDERLRLMVRCHGNQWRAVKAKLISKGKIWVEDGKIKARRVDEVLAEAKAFSEKQRAIRVGKVREKSGKSPGKVPEIFENLNENNDPPKPLTATATATAIDKKEGSLQEPKKENGAFAPDECALAYDAWNRLAEETGLTPAQVLNQTRRASLARRIGEAGGLKGWLDVLEKVRASSFCNGGGDRGWRIDFDAMIQAKTFTKLMEGSFDDKRNGTNGFHRASSGNSLKEKIGRAAKIFDERRASATGSGPDSGLLPFPRKGSG